MTYFNDTRRFGGFGGFFSGLVGRVQDALAYRAAYAQTLRELGALSTRELDDLGISPAKMDDIAASAAREAVANRG
ncbi:MAG: DUF1127 domain-containing protein [Pseudomonadota bacterium]